MEELNGFHKVCKINDLQENIGKRFMIDDVDVAVFKVDNEVYALNNVCPHQKIALIYDGYVNEGKVTCPMHGWVFDLKTGNIGDYLKGLDTYEVKIIDEHVYIKVFKKELNW